MGNYLSQFIKPIFTPEQLNFGVLQDAFRNVIDSYVQFLYTIARAIVGKYTNDVSREIAKYNTVKKELVDFLFEHRKFYKLKKTETKFHKELVFHTTNINYSDSFKQFMKLDDVKNHINKANLANSKFKFSCLIEAEKAELLERLKYTLGKSVIKNNDVKLFLKNNYLVDQDHLESDCSSYKQLKDLIDEKTKSCRREQVIHKKINKFPYKFKWTVRRSEDVTSCENCFEDIRIDQVTYRLGCYHFFCRICMKEMYATPEDCPEGTFQCPVCNEL